jgi:ADP-ribose pyrophosphatase
LTAGESKLDDGEFLDVFKAPLTEVMQWVRTGKITDVKTVIGAFWLDKFVSGTWQGES